MLTFGNSREPEVGTIGLLGENLIFNAVGEGQNLAIFRNASENI